MKKALRVLFTTTIFLLLALAVNAQIQFRDTYEESFPPTTQTITLAPTGNSAGRNTYAGNSTKSGTQYRILYVNSRWEIQFHDGGSFIAGYWNTTATLPDPPALNNGTWVSAPGNPDQLTVLTGNVISSVSNDATLLSLALSAGTLTPAFTSSGITYSASVPNGTASINITPTRNQANATIKINNVTAVSGSPFTVNLSVGNNPISVVVTAQDGTTTKNYTVNVGRALPAPMVIMPANGSANNTLTPTYTGTSTGNATVTVSVDGVVIGTTTAEPGGTWSLTQPSSLTQALHTLTATAQLSTNSVSAISNTNTFTVDVTKPNLTITSSAGASGSSTATSPIPFTATFSESVSGFALGSITATNATLGSFSGSGTTYSFTATPSANGAVTINVGANAAQDIAGNGNNAATQFSITYAAAANITAGSTFPSALSTTYGTASASSSVAVSGSGLSAGITATPSSTANFEVSADDITYGPSATIGSSGTVSGTIYVRLKATAAANASITGSVTLTSTGTNSPIVTIPTSSVAQRAITVTANAGQSKTYGNVDPTLTYAVSSGSLVSPDTFLGSLSRVAGENAGNYTITQGSLSAGSNYAVTFTPAVTFAINQRAITVTANAGQSKTYGNVNPTYTYTLSAGSLAFADTFTGSLARAAGENVANYAITQGTLALNGNYAITFTPGVTFAINQRAITVTANAGQSKTYGNINPAYTYTLSAGSLAFADTFTGSLARAAGENVANYAITQGTLALNGNYAITFTPGVTFAINQRAVTVTANAGQSKIYGDVDPTLTYTVGGAGLAFADTFSGSLGRAAGENVANYAITQGSLALSSNYAVTFTPGLTFAINQRAVTVTANAGQSKIYGNVDPTLTYTVGGAGLAFSDTFSGSLSRAAGENVANYAITQGTLAASGNYSLTFTPGITFAISQRAVTVTANAGQSKIYGNVDPTLTYTVGGGGLAFADTFTGSLSRAAGENVSNYAITQGTLSASGNYSLTFTPGITFAISQRAVTVTANAGQSKIYGNLNPTLTYTVGGAGLAFADTFSGSLSRAAGENVANYAITQGTLAASGNYSLTFTPGITFAISQRAVTVTANAGQSKIYGNVDPTLTYTVGGGGLAFADTFSGSLSRAAGENVSNYAITQGTLAASGNYSLTFTPGVTFAITQRAVTVTANAGQSKVYGNVDPTLTYTVGGGGLAFADTFSGSLSRAAGENVGNYAITQGTLAASGNYSLTFTPGITFAITQRAVTVTANAGQSKVYSNLNPTLTYSVGGSGLAFADTFSGSLSRAAGENVGNYAITQGTLAASGNYSLTFTPGVTFAITPKTLTVTASGINKAYDGTTAATVNLNDNRVTGDIFTLNYASAVFLTPSIGTNKTVNVTGITITGGASGNYTLGNTTAATTADITVRAIVVTADAKNKIYGEADPALTYTYTGTLVGTDAFTGTLSRAAGNNVGTYAISQGTLTLSNAGNYSLTYNTANLSITPKTLNVTATGINKLYDGNTTATVNLSDNRVAGDVFTESYTAAAFTSPVVGTNKTVNVTGIAITGGASGNYSLGNTTAATTADITPRTIVVTAEAKSKAYGDADPALTYTYTGTLIGTDAFAGALSRAVGENIGNYAINQGTLALSTNYSITFNSADLTIGAKTITVTAAAKSKTYGDADPALTYTFAPALVTGDSFSGALTRAVGENIGTYAINKGTLALNGNYTLTYVGADLTIGAKNITVTAAAKSKTYGDADPVLTYTSAPALVTGDSFTGALTRAVGENIGTYAINKGTLALNGNYALTYVGADLTIGAKNITVTAAAKSKTYGDADPALTYTFAPALVTGDSFSGALTRAVGENIGTYAINKGTLALNGNYALTYVGADLTIGAKTITVTAAAKSKTYGDADPALTYTFAPALVTGDSFSGALTRAVGENIGTYAINKGTLALNANYALTYVGADLTIGAKNITVTAAAKSKTYGDADPVLTYTSAPALVTGDSFTGALTRAVGENIGTYAINKGTLALNGNYALTYVGADLTIGAKNITVTAAAKSKTYGDADPALTYTFAPALVTGDSFSGALTRAVGENVGTYAINKGTLALNGNYALTYVGADLTIGAKTITVTAAAKSKTYGDADPALTYTFAPALVTGDSFSGALTRAVGENVGTYAINKGTLALNGNYTLTYVGADLTIGAKTITVTAAAKSKTYGDADPALTYTFAPALVTGDSFSGALARAVGENVGTYAINKGTLALNGNYTLTYVGADLTIGAKTITVTAAAKSKTYGDADPALTYTFAPALVTGDSFSGALTRAVGENIGTYAINKGTLALNGNYTLT
ncbi:MBG domain-containing protein, partial [Pedobacter sp. GSP4]|uniref:MBG domain-containing protein n=1 Tax=Pedobacter sp. GSP4 TaxID=3453716 RepID=UPI003EEB4ACE